jgi:hypothetical protein
MIALLAFYSILVLCGIVACFVGVLRSSPRVCALLILGGAFIPVAVAYVMGCTAGGGSNGDKIAGEVCAFFLGLPAAFAWLLSGAFAYAVKTSEQRRKVPH